MEQFTFGKQHWQHNKFINNSVVGENTSGSSSSEPSPAAEGLLSSSNDAEGTVGSANHLLTSATAKTDSSPSKCTLNNHKMEERKR